MGSAEGDIYTEEPLCKYTKRIVLVLCSVCVYRDSVAISCTVVFEHINIEGNPVPP